jgi:hypothetical protein
MTRCRIVLLPLALALLSSVASAQTRYYGEDNTGSESTRATLVNALAARNAFLSQLVGVGTADFESGSELLLAFPGAGTATLSTGYTREIPTGTNDFGRYPTSGVTYLETNANALTISFDQYIAAFGFYGIDLGDFNSQLTLRFYDGNTVVDTWTPYIPAGFECPNRYCGSVKFIGTISAVSFNRVTFTGTNTADSFGYDDMTIGTVEQVKPVPEPTSVVLLIAGFVGLVVVKRFRQRLA